MNPDGGDRVAIRTRSESARARTDGARANASGTGTNGSGRTTRRAYLRALGAGGLAAASGCSAGGRQSGSFLLGAYPRDPAKSTIRSFDRWIGRTHAVVPLYTNADQPEENIADFIDSYVSVTREGGHVPMVTWLPYLGTAERTPADIGARIAAGEYDEYVDPWAARLADWLKAKDDRRLYFRPLPEMNGDWLPWSAVGPNESPATFVEAWRHLHDRFSAAGVPSDRIQWVWNPNVREVGGVRTDAYYPGDEYVDWIGIDGYNFGSSREWSEWTAPEEVFDPMVSRMRTLADKPIGLPEFGSSSLRNGAYRPEAKSRWISDVFDYIERAGIKMACWFNIDKETDWAVFGGARGTASAEIGGTTYSVYPAYKRAAQRPTAITGDGGDGPILTRDEFTGTF